MVAEPGQLRDEDEDAIDDELDISEAQFDDEEDPEDAPPLTRYERAPWPGPVTGLIHIFLDGTFAVFNHLVVENDQGGCSALVRGHSSGAASIRLPKSDSFIVVQVAAMALVAGPACLIFAWATFERTVWRRAGIGRQRGG